MARLVKAGEILLEGGKATENKYGIVKPDGSTILTKNGVISIQKDFLQIDWDKSPIDENGNVTDLYLKTPDFEEIENE